MTESRYSIPAATHRVEEVILRSRFITTVGHAASTADARAFIARVSDEFADASHNCWAYVVGPPGSTAQIGMSDAGEPHGTAGRPMLTVLLHSGVGDICAVVTRYFGGTLLGKGGLVRAYSGGVRSALESMPRAERVPAALVTVVLDYASVTQARRLFDEWQARIVGDDFGQDVTYTLHIAADRADDFGRALFELTRGAALIDVAPAPG